jgi:hypothetical protein
MAGGAMEPAPTPPTVLEAQKKVVADCALASLAVQATDLTTLQSKATSALGFGTLAGTFAGGLAKVSAPSNGLAFNPSYTNWVIALFVGLAVSAIIAIFPRRWTFTVEADKMLEIAQANGWPDLSLMYESIVDSVEGYRASNRCKLIQVQIAVILSYALLAALAAVIIYATLVNPAKG